MYRMELAHCQ